MDGEWTGIEEKREENRRGKGKKMGYDGWMILIEVFQLN
jgi:hypothetical protein